MPEILSQNEIDELLNNLKSASSADPESEELNTKKVKEYDFKTPKKLTKEQIKILLGIHENFARHLASYFSGILRTYCEISVTSIEELPYYEYNNALNDSIMMGTFDMKPIEGSILVDISNSVTFALIDRLLGGTGNNISFEHEFTEIEVSLMSKIFKQVALFMKEAWSNLVSVETEFQQVETNARLIQSMPMEEVVVLVMMDMSIGPVKGTIGLSIPCINLEGIIDQLSKNKMMPKRQSDQTQENLQRETVLNHIRDSALELHSILGETRLTIQEVANLQVGDVVRIGQRSEKYVKVVAGERAWFYGIMGVSRNRKAIKVKKIL